MVISLLAEELVRLGHTVTVFTTTSNGRAELDVPVGKKVVLDGVDVYYFKRYSGDKTQVSLALWKALKKEVRHFDLVHIHTWWNLLTLYAVQICARQGVQPVLSPHGMLSDYILQTNNAWLKRMITSTFGKKLLACTWLHVSTPMEWQESKRLVPSWQGRVIPNLVKLPARQHRRAVNEVFTIGFLSRVDAKKGLDILMRALGEVNFPFRLLIAGSGEAEYVHEMEALAHALGIAASVAWVGWKNGEDKFAFLAQADLFALTSHSENFAIVVIESLAVGTPVFISDQVGLKDFVAEQQLGWVTSLQVDDIARNLTAIARDEDGRIRICKAAPLLIREAFDTVCLTQQYLDFYQTVITNTHGDRISR